MLICHGPGPTNASRRTSSNARSNRGSVEPLATAIMVAKKPLISSRPALFFLGIALTAAALCFVPQRIPNNQAGNRTKSSARGVLTLSPAQQRPHRIRRIGLFQCWPVREGGGKRGLGSVARHEYKGNFQGIQPLCDRKALFMDQRDVEQRKIRRASGNHSERSGHACRGPHRLHPEIQDRLLEIERDDQIILDDQDVLGEGGDSVGGRVFHDLTLHGGSRSRSPRRIRSGIALHTIQALRPVPTMKPPRGHCVVCALVDTRIGHGLISRECGGTLEWMRDAEMTLTALSAPTTICYGGSARAILH